MLQIRYASGKSASYILQENPRLCQVRLQTPLPYGKCTRLFDQPAHAALPPCHCSRRQRAGCLQRQRFYQLHQFFENFPQFIRHYAVRISQPAAAYAGAGSLYPINNVSRPISSLGQLFSQINLKKAQRLIKAKAVFNLSLALMNLYSKEKSHLSSLHLCMTPEMALSSLCYGNTA